MTTELELLPIDARNVDLENLAESLADIRGRADGLAREWSRRMMWPSPTELETLGAIARELETAAAAAREAFVRRRPLGDEPAGLSVTCHRCDEACFCSREDS